MQTATPVRIAPSLQTSHGTPGLQAPLPQARVRPADSAPMTDAPEATAAPPETASQNDSGFAPIAVAPVAPAVPSEIAPSIEATPPPVSIAPNGQSRVPLSDYLGFIQFTKIRDAYMNRPDPVVNRANVPRPQPTDDLAQVRSQSRLTPQGIRELVSERQASQSLWDLRSQAKMNPNQLASPATRPSTQ